MPTGLFVFVSASESGWKISTWKRNAGRAMSEYKMLERKRKTKDPCVGCGLHNQRCLCESIPRLSLKTKVVLVIHHKELKRTTNSGKLAIKALENSEMKIRGQNINEVLNLSDLLTPNYRTMLFYPSADAVELTAELVNESSLPIQLIVPDGNWRQASKVYSRQPELKDILKVKISTPNISKQHLRQEHMPEGMSTLEAIAKALGIIEGPEVGKKLLDLYQLKLERTLLGRPPKHYLVTSETESTLHLPKSLKETSYVPKKVSPWYPKARTTS